MTRLYLPLTLPTLAELHAGAVLDTAEAFVAADESEESEYAALVAAAEVSAELVTGLADGHRRRVVLVADVVGEPPGLGLADVVAVHADPADDSDPGEDLGWYATQEIPDLIEGT